MQETLCQSSKTGAMVKRLNENKVEKIENCDTKGLMWGSSKILPIKPIVNEEKKKLEKYILDQGFKEVEFSRMMNPPVDCYDDERLLIGK